MSSSGSREWRHWEHDVQRLPEVYSNVLFSRMWSESLNHLGVAGGEKDGRGVGRKSVGVYPRCHMTELTGIVHTPWPHCHSLMFHPSQTLLFNHRPLLC